MSGINVRSGFLNILLTHKHGYAAKSKTAEYQGRPFSCDLSQNPETIPRHGELLPSICRSSFNYIPGKDHFVTEGESEVSMGVPNSTLLPTSLEYEHLDHWNSARQAQMIASGHLTADKLTGWRLSFVGNGVDTTVAGAFVLFIYGHIMLKADLLEWSLNSMKLMSQPVTHADDEDEDCNLGQIPLKLSPLAKHMRRPDRDAGTAGPPAKKAKAPKKAQAVVTNID